MKMLPLVAAAALAISTTAATADGHNDVGSAASIGGGLNESSTLLIGGLGALVLIGLAAGLGGSSSGTN